MEQQQTQPAPETPNDVPQEIDLNPGAILEKLDSWLDGFVRLLPNIVFAILLMVGFYFLARFLKGLVQRTATSRDRDNLGEVAGGMVKWIVIFVGFLLAMTVVLPSVSPGDLVAGLGVSSVAIGFAFKDILQNWLAGILILLRQPFAVGDEIEVNGYVGSVERIETRATIIRQYNAKRVVIPNSDIYTNAVKVITANDRIRGQYDVGVGYGDSIQEAKDVIRAAVQDVEGVDREKGVDVLTWDLAASWVTIRVRWWTKSQRGDVVQIHDRVLQAMKLALDDARIDMPYNTQVHLFHDQTEETDGDRTAQREGWPAPKEGSAPQPRWKREESIRNTPRAEPSNNASPENSSTTKPTETTKSE